jgi:hypothetical protein
MASPTTEQLPFLHKVLAGIADQKELLLQLWQTIYRAVSVLDVPQLFQAFDQSHLLYHLCVNDVVSIARVLSEQKMLPRSTRFSEFVQIDQRYQFNWFWCQIFPRISPNLQELPPTLFFSGDFDAVAELPDSELKNEIAKLLQDADVFECFLEQQRKHKQMKGWFDLINTQANRLMMINLDYLIQHPQFVTSVEMEQVIQICCITPELFNHHNGWLTAAFEQWDVMTERFKDGRGLRKMFAAHRSAYNSIWQGLRMIRCTAKAPLARTFRMLIAAIIQFVNIIQELDLGSEGLINIIGQLPGEVILKPFVFFNGTVTKDDKFIMSEQERFAWAKLDSAVFTLLIEKPGFMANVIDIQNRMHIEHEYAQNHRTK